MVRRHEVEVLRRAGHSLAETAKLVAEDRRHALRLASRPHCDEVGHLTYGQDAANALYHVVTQRHQARRSMIFTANKHPDDWGAAAIIDRVLERGRLLKLDGPSMHTQHLGLDAPAHAAAGSARVARISGIQGPECPEHEVIQGRQIDSRDSSFVPTWAHSASAGRLSSGSARSVTRATVFALDGLDAT